jgi:alpha-galactosidase
MSTIGFEGQDCWAGFRGPGHWPDADMLVLGKVGWGRKMHWTQLTPWEQYTHITLWAILASPMLLGCDMALLDDFTLSLLTNNEVLDVNQDPLGIQGVRFGSGDGHVTYIKPLEDGTLAVALFNLGDTERVLGFVPHKLGLLGDQTVRDLWRQKDVAKIAQKERFETKVPAHGCAFFRLSPGLTGEKLEGYYR